MFLTELLSELLPGAMVRHEPCPSRYEHVIGNLRNRTGWLDAPLKALVLGTRHRRMARLAPGQRYIELNPLLSPNAALLTHWAPLHIVHVVRDPRTWTRSMLAFRASRRLRPVVGFIPFARPRPVPGPEDWRALDPVARTLWWWRTANEQILALKPHCRRYSLFRYEDLFGPDPARHDAMRALLAEFGCGPKLDQALVHANRRVNPAPKVAPRDIPETAVRRACGDLPTAFGYDV